ncbi:MAG: VTC domain-containing protein [Acetatifactor sp.]|nr:VTC domain-containing protein [Acetatifactor sp.]
MEQENNYRHELKFSVSSADAIIIGNRLKNIMETDHNADADGKYLIQSIYFDNCYDKALREKIDGVNKREKFRIKFYNKDMLRISLFREKAGRIFRDSTEMKQILKTSVGKEGRKRAERLTMPESEASEDA